MRFGISVTAFLLLCSCVSAAPLICDGDSQMIARPGHIAEAQTSCALFAARRGTTYQNFSTSGAESWFVRNRIGANVAAQPTAKCALVKVGINNLWYRLNPNPPATTGTDDAYYQEDISRIVEGYEAHDIKVTFIASNPFWSSPYLQQFPAYLRALRAGVAANTQKGATLLDGYTIKPVGAPDSIDNCWNYPAGQDGWCYAAYSGDVFHGNATVHAAEVALCDKPENATACACNPD